MNVIAALLEHAKVVWFVVADEMCLCAVPELVHVAPCQHCAAVGGGVHWREKKMKKE